MQLNSRIYPSPLFKDLGTGTGFRSPYFSLFCGTSAPRDVQWLEALTENHMPWNDGVYRRPFYKLLEARKNRPITLHGVSMNLGSTDPLDRAYLKRLKQFAHEVEPEWISDHLCFTGADHTHMHDLFPLPYTEEAIHHLVSRIQQVQDTLRTRIVIENVSSYIEYASSSMPEWQFLSAIADRADCGILLDVNNVYVSATNHGFDPETYIRSLPAHRIAQIHLAGHSRYKNYLVDTHDAPVCGDVWNLYRFTLKTIGLRSSMIERDAEMPEWSEIETETHRIAEIRSESSAYDWSPLESQAATA